MAFKLPGLIGGLGITFKTMLQGAVTVQYPHENESPAPRARGVIALKEENCTVCMLCSRSCPDWCIYIEGHTDNVPVVFNERFKSNWDLSGARAGAVADRISGVSGITPGRMSVSGYADTRPLENNNTATGRRMISDCISPRAPPPVKKTSARKSASAQIKNRCA